MPQHSEQVSLVSRWKLKAGLDQHLLGVLQALAGEVETAEPDTLMYRVHLPTEFPLASDDSSASAPWIPLADQKEVVFVEVYRNAAAFAKHTQGQVFKRFLTSTKDYFEPDPKRPGWPVTDTVFTTIVSGYVRADIDT